MAAGGKRAREAGLWLGENQNQRRWRVGQRARR
jgi:hypothetical protein